jgi:BlaI family transcriptional regulator, penicillinase repressor
MSKASKLSPSESELEVLQILWQYGPKSVRFVNDEINKYRTIGYTTTLKTMQIMLDKGLLSRKIIERIHVFSATVKEENMQAQLVKQFIQTTFRGSASSLVMRLLGSKDTTLDELEKIKELINRSS